STLTGIQDAVRSALENVMRNAIRYTAEGTTVDVTIRTKAEGPISFTQVIVRDHGPGIPEAALKDVFLPFRRVEPPKQGVASAGLGLAIARRAIELHGGSILARNAADGGLEVEMTFPTNT